MRDILHLSTQGSPADESNVAVKTKPEAQETSLLTLIQKQLGMYFSPEELVQIFRYLQTFPPLKGFSVKHRPQGSFVVYESARGWTIALSNVFREEESMIMRMLDHPEQIQSSAKGFDLEDWQRRHSPQ